MNAAVGIQSLEETTEKQDVANMTSTMNMRNNTSSSTQSTNISAYYYVNAESAKTNVTSYYTLWNYTTHSIDIPNKKRQEGGGRLTSLEILETVLAKDNKNNVGSTNEGLQSCFIPNTLRTRTLIDSGEILALPVLNLGMPKCGSTTLQEFFRCAGFRSLHGQNGACMEAAIREGRPPIAGCKRTRYKQVLTQLDVQIPPNCWFPQISFLDEIHQEEPNATFVLNFRPVNDWIHSARHWYGMADRWGKPDCITKIPGLVKEGNTLTDQEIRNWWCGHVKHVREFVEQYPTHKLIELDLYDTEGSSKSMASLFNANETCWGHANEKNPKRRWK
jgi:hypothetical protein